MKYISICQYIALIQQSNTNIYIMTYTLTTLAKKEILKDNSIDLPLTGILRDCCDTQFFNIVFEQLNK